MEPDKELKWKLTLVDALVSQQGRQDPRMQHAERPCSDVKRGEKAPGLLEMVVGSDSGLSTHT